MKTNILKKIIINSLLLSTLYNASFSQTCNLNGGNALPSLGSFNGAYYDLNTTITLTGNLTLINGNVDIASGVNIIVPSGVVLTLDYMHLYPCDNDMWGGIVVEAGGKLIIKGGSKIESAEYGVRANENSNSSNPTKIDITDSDFDINYTGILVDPNTSNRFNSISLHVAGTWFNGTSGLINHSNINYSGVLPYVGIELYDINCIIGTYSLHPNNFLNLNNGILSHRCILGVKKSEFNYIGDASLLGSPIICGRGISGDGNSISYYLNVKGDNYSHIYQCKTGIYSNVAVNIFDYTIDHVESGIYLEKLPAGSTSCVDFNNLTNVTRWGILNLFPGPIDYLEILQNTILQDDQLGIGEGSGIALWDNLNIRNIVVLNNNITLLNGNHGIQLEGTQSVYVNQNTIDLSNNLTQMPEYYGISIKGANKNYLTCNYVYGSNTSASNDYANYGFYTSQGVNNLIRCNIVSSISHCYEFQGNCSMQELFKGNEMNNSYVGLNLSFSAAMNSPVTNSQTDEGNIWNGPFNGPNDAVNTGGTPSASIFKTNPNISGLTPSNPSPSIGWFQNSSNSNYFACDSDIYCPQIPGGGGGENNNSFVGNFEYLIANNYYHPDDFQKESVEMANRYLFEKIKRDSTLLNEPVFSDFFNSYQDSSLSEFSQAKDSLSTVYEVTQLQNNILIYGDSMFKSFQSSLNVVDSLFNNNVIDSSVSQHVVDSILLLMTNVADSIKPIAETIKLQQYENADAIVDLYDNLSANNVIELNEKTVQNIYLNSVCKNIMTLNSDQISSLQSIIHQCPFTGGPIVYLARALYHMSDSSEIYYDSEVCHQLGLYRKAHTKEDISLFSFVFPNPTNKSFTLEYKIPDFHQSVLKIYNSSFVLIHTEIINPKETQKTINVESFNTDLYLFTIEQENHVISSGKINVIK